MPNPYKHWTDPEREYVIAHYKIMTIPQVAEHLDRSPAQIYAWLSDNHLRKGSSRVVKPNHKNHQLYPDTEYRPARSGLKIHHGTMPESPFSNEWRAGIEQMKQMRGTYNDGRHL